MKNLLVHHDAGYTIQELLVVLIVGSLLVGFCFSLFLFANKMLSSWHKNVEFRRDIESAMQAVATDVSKSRRLLQLTDSLCSLEKPTGAVVNYRYDGRHIWRNDIPVIADTAITCALSMKRVASVDRENLTVKIMVHGEKRPMEYNSTADILVPKSSVQQFGGVQ